MPREILVDWTTPAGGGYRSVYMFGMVSDVEDQRIALGNMLESIDGYLSSSTTWTIETSGRELSDSTGTLTGTWGESTPQTGTGGVSAYAISDASQALLRWDTGHIVGGRYLKGRTYIPGVAIDQVVDGNLQAATAAAFASAAQQLINDAVQMGVWKRPTSGTGGVWWAADTGTCWNEFAVLRRRRN